MFNQQINNLGTETAFSVLARADQLSRMGNNIINLGIGQPDFKTPTHIVEAGIKALKRWTSWVYTLSRHNRIKRICKK